MLSYYTATSGLTPYERGYHTTSLIDRFWSKVSKSDDADGCWVWTGGHTGKKNGPKGYGCFGLYYKVIRAHRFSWELHYGPISDDLWVLHKCDNRPCVRPDHLFLGTNQDNCLDAVKKGLWGDHSKRSRGHKLGLRDVLQIKEQLSIGVFTNLEIASWWGVDPCTVSGIKLGRTWKRVHTYLLDE